MGRGPGARRRRTRLRALASAVALAVALAPAFGGGGARCGDRGAGSTRGPAPARPARNASGRAARASASALLEGLEASEEFGDLPERRPGRHTDEPHLQNHPGRARLGHLVDELGHRGEGALELEGILAGDDGRGGIPFFLDHVDQIRADPHDAQDHQIPQELDELPHEVGGVGAAGHDLGDLADHCLRPAFEGCREELVEAGSGGDAQLGRDFVADEGIAAECDQLVQQGQRVTHGAGGLPGDDGDGGFVGLHLFGREHGPERVGDLPLGDEPEVVALAARADGDGNLVALGGREDELHVGRRLLEGFQERVERAGREHVDLIDDDHLEAVARGPEGERLLQPPHVFDGVVRRAVDLLHVHVHAGRDVPTGVALVAGGRGGTALAIEALGEEPRGGRLAHAADAGEEKGVRDAPLGDRVREGSSDVLLADQFLEGLGSILPREDRVSHGARSLAAHPRNFVEGFARGGRAAYSLRLLVTSSQVWLPRSWGTVSTRTRSTTRRTVEVVT